eukprot:maker-scaffold612_size124412-snap-gene-0.25 protein:Tk03318 transcript:maker-scaffold612_size124412-snap-gene-0.25-mRNA-1 annotation:"beta- -n-acetylgalactosaminyltransferase bre-4-like"
MVPMKRGHSSPHADPKKPKSSPSEDMESSLASPPDPFQDLWNTTPILYIDPEETEVSFIDPFSRPQTRPNEDDDPNGDSDDLGPVAEFDKEFASPDDFEGEPDASVPDVRPGSMDNSMIEDSITSPAKYLPISSVLDFVQDEIVDTLEAVDEFIDVNIMIRSWLDQHLLSRVYEVIAQAPELAALTFLSDLDPRPSSPDMLLKAELEALNCSSGFSTPTDEIIRPWLDPGVESSLLQYQDLCDMVEPILIAEDIPNEDINANIPEKKSSNSSTMLQTGIFHPDQELEAYHIVSLLRPSGAGLVWNGPSAGCLELLEQRGEDSPSLAELVRSYKVGLVADKHVQDELFVRLRESDIGISLGIGQIQLGFLQSEIDAGHLVHHLAVDGLFGLDPENQLIPLGRVGEEPASRHVLELDPQLGLALIQGLSGSHDNGDAVPQLVADLQDTGTISGCHRVVRHTRIILVALSSFLVRIHWIAHILPDDAVVHANGWNGSQNFNLLIPNVLGVQRHGLVHGSQTHDLEEMILEDVSNDAELVEVSASAIGAERLFEIDHHAGETVPVPTPREESVPEAQADKVLDHLLPKIWKKKSNITFNHELIMSVWLKRKMREVILAAATKGQLKFFTVILVTLVICTQFMVVFNAHNKIYIKPSETINEDVPANAPKSIVQILDNLPEPQVDEYLFKSRVLRPHEGMIEKFPKHPAMVIDKLDRFVDVEAEKTKGLMESVQAFRKSLGLDVQSSDKGSVANLVQGFWGRKLKSLEPCPTTPKNLLGPLIVRQSDAPNWEPGSPQFIRWYGQVSEGGAFHPEECEARQKVAIIIPYRDRAEHLRSWLYHMHPMLQRQQLDYQIFVVEQTGKDPFNRAALMNVGFKEAIKRGSFQCFIFHDVDLVPEDDRNMYTCPANETKHLAVTVNKWKYSLIYENYFGGVTALNKDQFEKINGFSNLFYGWGGEDDDLHHRVTEAGFGVFRYPGHISRFAMLKHNSSTKGENVDKLMEKSKNNHLKLDGLSSLKYKKLNQKTLPLYTWLLVKLPKAPPKFKTTMMEFARTSLWSGLTYMGGGIAKHIAAKTEEGVNESEPVKPEESWHVY